MNDDAEAVQDRVGGGRRTTRTAPTLTIDRLAELPVASFVRARMAGCLDDLGWPLNPRDDMVSAVHEAVANVIDHAYRDGPRGPVRLTAYVRLFTHARRGQAVATVRDWGRWRPAPSDPGHRGHGLKVMRGTMDAVEIRQHPDGTEVILTGSVVPIRRTAGSPASPLRSASPHDERAGTSGTARRRVDPRWMELRRQSYLNVRHAHALLDRARDWCRQAVLIRRVAALRSAMRFSHSPSRRRPSAG